MAAQKVSHKQLKNT